MVQLNHAEEHAKNSLLDFEAFDMDTVDGMAEGAFHGVDSSVELPVFLIIDDDRKSEVKFDWDDEGNETIEMKEWKR